MFCPKCGSEVQDGGKFCNSCGNPMSQSEAPQAYGTPPLSPGSPRGGSSINSKTVMGIVAGVVVLLVIILLVSGPGNNPEAVSKAFMGAVYNGDFNKAANYCTPDAKKNVDELRYMSAFLFKVTDSKPTSYSVTSSTATTASVKVYDQKSRSLGTIRLEKINGKWLVSNM